METDRTANKDRICEAAKAIFLEKGYAGAKIADIAEVANVSPATIYKYYAGKKALFEDLNIPEARNINLQYDQKRSEIIQIALILFGENGYDGTSMELIAQKAGYSKAALYQYFENKNELFSAAMKETPFHFDIKKLDRESSGLDLEATIKKIGLAYVKMFNDPKRIAFVRTIIRDSNKNPEIGDIYHREGIGYVAQYIADSLEKHQAQLKDFNMHLAAKTYVASLFAFVIQYKLVVGVERNFTDDEIVDISTKIFLEGVLDKELKAKN